MSVARPKLHLDNEVRGLPRLLHKAIQHHLPAGLVEIDRQLVAVDARHRAGAELDVEDAGAGVVGRGSGRFGGEFALDQQRAALAAAAALAEAAAALGEARAGFGLVLLRPLPARRVVAGAETF